MSELEERIYGALVGVAAGDAMGMPSSMMSPEIIRSTFKSYITDFLPAPKGHVIHNKMVAGQITDDTQQTLSLADSIIEKGCIDPHDVAKKLIEWAESVDAFDSMILGPSTLRSLYAIKAGRPIEESGTAGDTNGAAMKISPAGIFGMGNRDKTVDAVAKVCMATHNTNIAIAGASAVAMAVGKGITGEQDMNTIIAHAFQAVELGMGKGRIWYGASIIDRTRLALEIVSGNSEKSEKLETLYKVIGAGVAMTETVPVCLAIAKLAEGNPVEAIQMATNLGGDCDTIASITGGICGAISGVKAFPNKWIEKIEKVNHLNLEEYAHKLYQVVNKN
ncbi:MAG: ADP-ribosylglycohydrolase family protein [Calditrichaceae bacterium]